MNGDPIFQGATVSLTDIMFGSSHATPPCGELNLLDAVLFRLTLPPPAATSLISAAGVCHGGNAGAVTLPVHGATR